MRDVLLDARAVFWKERREFLTAKGWRSFSVQTLLLVVLFGVAMPYSQGPHWVSESYPLAFHFLFVPFIATLPYVADAFAGERERKTIESLLATGISEKGVFVGKCWAIWLVAYLQVLAVVLAGWIVLNIYNYVELELHSLSLYSPPASVLLLLGSASTVALSTGLGVLISLRSETVRGAQQASGMLLLGISIPLLFGLSRLIGPSGGFGWRAALGFTVGVGLAAYGMLRAGIAAFRRERLIIGGGRWAKS
ncbi:MAG TPA: ABC transporter permease [Candidatus Latescibacteria bacterium]|nr:ABC transporter permease [Candidatus Latescibacterota bacterium]